MRRFPGGKDFPCVDYSIPAERVLRRVSDVTDNDRAAKYVARNRDRCKSFAACYVISSEGSSQSKIGFSCNPHSRLKTLSTGFPTKPKIYGLFWSFKNPASIIEWKALEAAKQIGIRANGEWVNLDGPRAVDFVLSAVWRSAVFVDSREFWEQWTTRSMADMPSSYWDSVTDEMRAQEQERYKDAVARGWTTKYG